MSLSPILVDVTDKVSVDAPLSLYLSLRRRPYPYLLESVEKSGQRARFSFVGAAPSALVTVKDRQLSVEMFRGGLEYLRERLESRVDVQRCGKGLQGEILPGYDAFDALQAAIPCRPCREGNDFGRQVFTGGAIGYLAYDLVSPKSPGSGRSPTPDAMMAIAESTFIFDHLTRRVYFAVAPILPGAKTDLVELIEGADSGEDLGDGEGRLLGSGDPEAYEGAVEMAKEHILAGDIFQVVLARTATATCDDTVALYRRLRRINPSPYTYLFEFGDMAIVGASPETLFSAYSGVLKVNPIAGTCPRGSSPAEDQVLAQAMLKDEKELAEHVMLVDLGRNDVRSVCGPGSVSVEDFMSVVQYSHVQHIETTVRGTLRPECDQFDAARAIIPAGTLSGAPKLRAMEIIQELEGHPRGIYGGGIGYFSSDGSADFAIAIRSIILHRGVAEVSAGAGIVADSQPHREYLETERKMAPMMRALGVA